MKCVGYDVHWDESFAKQYNVKRAATIEEAIAGADVVSLHMSLDEKTRGVGNANLIAKMKRGSILINTARGGLVVEKDIAAACKSGQLLGYGADVLEKEPQPAEHMFREIDNIIITPHVGSRTFESVERQAMKALTNTLNFLRGDKDYVQANSW